MSRILRSREALVLLLLIVLVAIIGFINPNFVKSRSLLSILNSSLILVLISIGEMFVIITRGIDVSVGAIVGLSAVILGVSLNAGVPLAAAIALTLLTGLLAGSVNSVGIVFFKVPPIIMTLGTLGIYRGSMLLITGGSWIETIPPSIKSMNGWTVLGVRGFIWLTLIIAIVTAILMRKLKIARYLYAVGDNEEGAYVLGIPVKATVFAAYALAGLFAGAAAVVFVAQIGFVPMQTGNGLELKAIAAVVLGGVNLTGGVGSPISAVIGAVFLTAIDSMLVFLKVPGYWNNAFGGAILLAAVYVDYRVRKTIEARQRQIRTQVRASSATEAMPQSAIKEA
jgi:AI-2 transport system permease protein